MIHSIRASKAVEPYKITLDFNTSETFTVDLKQEKGSRQDPETRRKDQRHGNLGVLRS